MNYGIHAERVTEAPDAFYAWEEDWKDRVEDAAHVLEGRRGVALLPDFSPVVDPMWHMYFPGNQPTL